MNSCEGPGTWADLKPCPFPPTESLTLGGTTYHLCPMCHEIQRLRAAKYAHEMRHAAWVGSRWFREYDALSDSIALLLHRHQEAVNAESI